MPASRSDRRSYKLSEFSGRFAEVAELDLPASEAQQLKSLGVFVGQSIQLQRFGDALIITAAGGRVAIAKELAQKIAVRVTDEAAA